jgi:hypothetical protein
MAAMSTTKQIGHIANHYVRPGLVVLLSAATCLALVLFTIVHWTEHQILTPENWAATVAPLPKNSEVANALSSYITTNLFSNVPIEEQLKDALPPRATFLASPLVSQLQTLTQNLTRDIISGENFQQLWTTVNKNAMNRLVTNARNPNQQQNGRLEQVFSIDLSGVKSFISKRLGTAASAFPALDPGNSKALAIKTDLQAKRQQIWSYIRKIDYLAAVLPFILIASLFGALAMSRNRRRTLLEISIVTAVLLLCELIAGKIARQSILGKVKHAEYHSAVSYIFNSLTASLHSVIIFWLFAAIIVIVLCELTSPALWAVRLRKRISNFLPIAPPIMHGWHTLRAWVSKYRAGLWCGVFALWLFWMAFIADISYAQSTRGILIAIFLAETIFILSHPRIRAKS